MSNSTPAKVIQAGFQGANTEPVVGLDYGPSGSGKTAASAGSFPRWLFVTAPGALKPAVGLYGFKPQELKNDQFTVNEVIKVIEQARGKGYAGIVVDDFSLIAENTLAKISGSGWHFWDKVRETFLNFRYAARSCGVHVWVNCHEVGPRTKEKDNQFIRGGPRLPIKDMTEDLPVLFDMVLRASVDPNKAAVAATQAGHVAWPGVYRCSRADSEWITKDRHAVTPDFSPMNQAELLRAAGYVIDRAPGLEWQEELIEAGARAILGGHPEIEVYKQVLAHGQQKTQDPRHLRWMLRDCRDRVVIRRANSAASLFAEFIPAA